MLGPAVYVFAVLVLFQFSALQVARWMDDGAPPQDFGLMVPAAEAAMATPASSGLPVRIKIPKIHVNAVIDHVGILKDGSMGIPSVPSRAAWYMLGPTPGATGSAVIDGHVNWWNGRKGVFEHLKDLKPGDTITIQDDQGIVTSFMMRSSKTIGRNDDATSVFRSTDGKSHLNLVTCTGVWDRAAQMYTKRLVIFADKVQE